MANISLNLKKSGHFVSGGDLRQLIQSEIDPVLKRAALVLQRGIQENTPVRTGTLRRSMATGAPEWQGTKRRVKVGSNLVYARPVNVRGKSRGYFKRGIDSRKAQALNVLRSGLSGLVEGMFVQE